MKKEIITNKPQETDNYQEDIENELSSVVSATECTGLMYMPPQDEAEEEAYADIYVVPVIEEDKK